MKIRRFLDPIWGLIELDPALQDQRLLIQIIDTPQFQRLRRIRQLGFSSLTYYGAENSRFVHSIGVMQVARNILSALERKYPQEVQPQALAITLAALLHDLGHGPLSHSSEAAFGFHHEDQTAKILSTDNELTSLLKAHDPSLPQTICSLLGKAPRTGRPWQYQIVSAQLDCDRADYLIRDSHQTGTKYGYFQLDRIIQSLELAEIHGERHLVVEEKALNAVEDYLFARYSMYQQVYHHKTTLGADALFGSCIARARDLALAGASFPHDSVLLAWLTDASSIDTNIFHKLDDARLFYFLSLWSSEAEDFILRDLALRILNRRLFKARRGHQLTWEAREQIKAELGAERAPYYFLTMTPEHFPYRDDKAPILIKKTNRIAELSEVSALAAALLQKGNDFDTELCFFPEEILAKINS